MTTATQAVRSAKQPRGGYVPPKMMVIMDFADDEYRDELVLGMSREKSQPAIVGVVVDYLTRFMLESRIGMDTTAMKWDRVPRHGIRNDIHMLSEEEYCKVKERVQGLDADSVDAMFMLTAWDTMYRAGIEIDPDTLHPDEVTTDHVIRMVAKALEMLGDGEVAIGPTFIGGMPDGIQSADADFIRDGWLVDMKVSKKEAPDITQTLQLAVYYIMGKMVIEGRGNPPGMGHFNTYRDAFRNMHGVEILNPRCGVMWRLLMKEVPDETIEAIIGDVMGGYSENGVDLHE